MNRRARRQAAKKGDVMLGLDFEKAWCREHLTEEFKAEHPPAVGVVAMGNLLSSFMTHPLVRADPEIETVLDIASAADRYSPLCCFLGDEKVDEILRIAVEQGT